MCIAARNYPRARDVSVDSRFKAVGSLATGLQDARRIVWIGCARVGAILTVCRSREAEIATSIPLSADFIVSELLGLYLLRDRRQRRELVSGTRQVRHAV